MAAALCAPNGGSQLFETPSINRRVGALNILDGRIAYAATGAVSTDERGVIATVAFLGYVVRVRMRPKERVIIVDTFNSSAIKPPTLGEPATVTFAREDMIMLAAG